MTAKAPGKEGEKTAVNGHAGHKVLIVDDDPLVRLGLEKFVQKLGYEATTAASGKKGLDKIEKETPTIVLLDLKLPDSLDGLEVLRIIKKTRPEVVVIMISGQTEIHGAVEAMKLGALDYLEKPIDFDKLRSTLESAIIPALPSVEDNSILADLTHGSEKMAKVVDIVRRLALKSDITILVLGETGTGKNFLCRKIHELSPRRDATFVQIVCSNIPDHLIESELFGYEKGAFTDAKNSKQGLVEVASGGTLLLDEIGEMPYQFQSKILTLLEEKRYRRIGALQDHIIDIRILAATNKDLQEQVQAKKFRMDLFYRLNVASIELPPLRERPEDIPYLAQRFLFNFSGKYNTPNRSISDSGMQLLQQYHWPGNVRQLKNLIEKLVVLSDKEVIGADEISSNLAMQPQGDDKIPAGGNAGELESALAEGLSLAEMEEKYIKSALKLSGGNQRKAADLLNISRDTLRYRLKKLDIAPVDD